MTRTVCEHEAVSSNDFTDLKRRYTATSQFVTGIAITIIVLCILYYLFPTQAEALLSSIQCVLQPILNRCYSLSDTWTHKFEAIAKVVREDDFNQDENEEDQGLGLHRIE